MRIPRILLPSLFALAFTMNAAQSVAAPLGERKVVVDQEKLKTLNVEDQQAVLDLQARLETILATDRSTLSSEQRKELRAEYKGLKKEMDQYNAGGTVIYLSTAGIIIILLLLIILL